MKINEPGRDETAINRKLENDMTTMSATLTTIRTADFAELRATIGALSSVELRGVCSELKIAGLSRGSKKACSKAILDLEVAHRQANGGLDAADAPAPAPQAPAKAPKAPKAKKGKAASTKAPKAKKAKAKKAPKPEPKPEPRTDLPVDTIAVSSREAIEDLMTARSVTFEAALDLLVKVGRSRLRATDKYYREQVAAKEASKK